MDRSDSWHDRVMAWWQHNRRPVVVPLTVIPEVTYLLQTRIGPHAELAFVQAVASAEFITEPFDINDFDRVAETMAQYANFPLGFVDASIVAIAERLATRELLTTDRRHFGAVKPKHAKSFSLLP